MNLTKFADTIINLDDVQLLVGTTVVLKDGKKHRISRAAADAVLEWLTPSENRRLELLRNNPGKPKGSRPSDFQRKSARQDRRHPKSQASSAPAQLQHHSS